MSFLVCCPFEKGGKKKIDWKKISFISCIKSGTHSATRPNGRLFSLYCKHVGWRQQKDRGDHRKRERGTTNEQETGTQKKHMKKGKKKEVEGETKDRKIETMKRQSVKQ
jgi:hypothetical protein